MTRGQKLKKLANAIRAYCGVFNQQTDKWIHLPQRNARVRVECWLFELGLPEAESLAKIDGFKTVEDFHRWLRTIE